MVAKTNFTVQEMKLNRASIRVRAKNAECTAVLFMIGNVKNSFTKPAYSRYEIIRRLDQLRQNIKLRKTLRS